MEVKKAEKARSGDSTNGNNSALLQMRLVKTICKEQQMATKR